MKVMFCLALTQPMADSFSALEVLMIVREKSSH